MTKQFAVEDRDRPLEWFRFQTNFMTDPRIGTLPLIAQWFLVAALCATAQRVAPCSDAEFAWWARKGADEIQGAKRLLVDAGLINDEWVPTDWDKRQPPIDRTRNERQRRHVAGRRASASVGSQYEHSEVANAVTNAVSNSLVTHPQERTGHTGHHRQDTQDITDRTEQGVSSTTEPRSQPAPASKPIDATTAGSSIPIPSIDPLRSLQDSLLKRGKKPGTKKLDDFEAINDRVEKLVKSGKFVASDVSALAKVASITEKQARVSVMQLRDRRRI